MKRANRKIGFFCCKNKKGECKVKKQEAIDYLNNLQKGMFCTINLPLYGNEVIPITAMYMGKDKDGRYNFIDTGRFIMSKEFIENKEISIDKNFDEEKAMEIHSKVRMKCEKNKNRERAGR